MISSPRLAPFRRAGAALTAACACVMLPACSHPGPVHVNGLAGLGATSANWNVVHQATGAGDGRDFGPLVDTGAGSKPTYGDVTFAGGHVAGWVMAFPAGTRLVSAERLLAHELPADTQQTASLRQQRQAGPGACEVVSYQSLQLRLAFSAVPALSAGKFSVSFFDVLPGGSMSTSYVRVNRAVVGNPSPVSGPTCP